MHAHYLYVVVHRNDFDLLNSFISGDYTGLSEAADNDGEGWNRRKESS